LAPGAIVLLDGTTIPIVALVHWMPLSIHPFLDLANDAGHAVILYFFGLLALGGVCLFVAWLIK
jgi:hypothetical protein